MLLRYKVITQTNELYFIHADSLAEAWNQWFANYGRAIVAVAIVQLI